MMQFNEWEEQNNQFLSVALSWLRARLEAVAQQDPESVLVQNEGFAASRNIRSKRKKERSTEEEQAYTRALEQAESMVPSPALLVLRDRFHLSAFETHVLFLCIAMELDTRTATLCAQAQGHPSYEYPTFALAMKLFEKPAWEVLSPERPLRYWRFLEVIQRGNQSLIMGPLKADECIVHFVKGLNYMDERLAPFVIPMELELGGQDDSPNRGDDAQHSLSQEITKDFVMEWETGRRPTVNLVGPDGETKQEMAETVARSLGHRMYRLPIEWLPQQIAEVESVARLWQRESLLLNVGLYVDAQEHEKSGQGEGHISALNRFISRTRGLLFLATRDAWSYAHGPMLQYEITKPTSEVQAQTWAQILEPQASNASKLLASQFSFSLSTIKRLARTTCEQNVAKETNRLDQVWLACLKAAQPNLDKLAQRLEAKATWDDLVLPEQETQALRQIVAQVRHRNCVYEEWGFAKKMNRGLGISVVFAGESGTGKTMAAEVIANELCLNLYRIDLSGVVSKYIGETEKNLRRVFDAAEDGGAILFFDEADALFGKRSEVKDSHDRYANIEVNYLLQRLEAYRGLAILATNMKQAMDVAFVRRLRFIVNFPFPDRTERKAIWSHVLPAEVPQEGVDVERLSQFTLTGGSIHAIALQTAFLAADNGGLVTMPHVLEAIRAELRKQDRPIVETEFQ